jgi:hypothetical protein
MLRQYCTQSCTVVIVFTLAGLAVGGALAWLVARFRIVALDARKSELECGLESAQDRLTQQQAENASLLAAQGCCRGDFGERTAQYA